jgi:hypothetical protein
MGQGGEVRRHQAGLIRGHNRIFHNLSFRELRASTKWTTHSHPRCQFLFGDD